jgi:hypothetical protein
MIGYNPCMEKKPIMRKLGLKGYNKPKRTPSHPKKSHVVMAKVGEQTKLIRFGEQGASTAGKPKSGESERMKAKRKSFKARHAKNIAKGKMSAAYWADKVKW